ncbi:palmitoyltransferase DHHC6, putative [Plasmodium ovale]|uniref:Palmitoyltransferase n=1 Tax=Plasmodium ovale TaxID=36330 RepID=A0A1D3U882_PLAOA|nr:palmitoyltransferase DHHC6, putative [Plasmodium ovale]
MVKNIFPLVFLTVRLAVLITCVHLKNEQYAPSMEENVFLFFYGLSFLLYVVSSLRDPGYVTSCPLRYISKKRMNEFKRRLRERRTGEGTGTSSAAPSVSSSVASSTASTCSSTEITRHDELNSLTIIHREMNDTVITERGIRKRLKGMKKAEGVEMTEEEDMNQGDERDKPTNCQQPRNRYFQLNVDKRAFPYYTNRRKCYHKEKCFNHLYHTNHGSRSFRQVYNPPFRVTKDTLSLYRTCRSTRTRERYISKPLSLKWLYHMDKYFRKTSIDVLPFPHLGQDEEVYSLKEEISLCKLNNRQIIFSTDIKKEKKKKPFHIRNDKVYQYNTRLLYCDACNVLQLLRSKHCTICRRCVRTFDHHCPWMNNCVAENNRCFFLFYLYFEDVTIFFALKFVIRAICHMFLRENGCFFCWLVSLFLILTLLFAMILCLAIYHTYLCFINETTWENVRKGKIPYLKNCTKSKKYGPFFLSYRKNLLVYFCYVPLPCAFLQRLRSLLLPALFIKGVATFGKEGEILWKKVSKPSRRSPGILCQTLERLVYPVRKLIAW